MLTKETEEIVMKYSGLLKNIDGDISSLKVKIENNHLKTLDLMHEADPRNHIEGMSRKRKVDSREAMGIGLRLKALTMEHRDLKDELATLEIIRGQFPKGSKSELAVTNVSSRNLSLLLHYWCRGRRYQRAQKFGQRLNVRFGLGSTKDDVKVYEWKHR